MQNPIEFSEYFEAKECKERKISWKKKLIEAPFNIVAYDGELPTIIALQPETLRRRLSTKTLEIEVQTEKECIIQLISSPVHYHNGFSPSCISWQIKDSANLPRSLRLSILKGPKCFFNKSHLISQPENLAEEDARGYTPISRFELLVYK